MMEALMESKEVKKLLPVLAGGILAVSGNLFGQDTHWPFPCPEDQIVHYTAYHVSEPITINGRLDEPAWRRAPHSPRYADIISGKRALFDTYAQIVWDDQNLYIGVHLQEPLVHAKYTTNNSPVYYDNDAEVFIGGKDAYYEYEMNAFNTTYEVFFVWADAYQKDGYDQLPDFLADKMVPFNGVGFTNHPRGGRLGNFNWHFPGKQTAVFIDGTINNDADRDRGWTAELAFPWKGMQALARGDHRALPPHDGDVWRIDFSRFNTYKEAPPAGDSGGWTMSRHGIWDSHIPECFPYIRFSTNNIP